MHIPIKLAAFPVGAHKRTLGWFGLSSSFLRIFSACIDIALIVALFPTPTDKDFIKAILYEF